MTDVQIIEVPVVYVVGTNEFYTVECCFACAVKKVMEDDDMKVVAKSTKSEFSPCNSCNKIIMDRIEVAIPV